MRSKVRHLWQDSHAILWSSSAMLKFPLRHPYARYVAYTIITVETLFFSLNIPRVASRVVQFLRLRNFQECSDELLVGMDQQLKLLEDDCATYRQLIDMLKEQYSNADVASLKKTLRNLQVEFWIHFYLLSRLLIIHFNFSALWISFSVYH
ncbi:unnamed protein product [Cylicostephanus goldi]|uniref:Uncharacterized protein n=1 Tax=Cylicostephanus goldi TaxID=71465 RepID=A0A3P6U3D7_CYLGO|nr:unnamed protein product [Cylicostephanus goldi]